MGTYLNPGSDRFEITVNSDIYVDKSEMIAYLNSILNTEQRYVSVSRPRRFGKSIAANKMLLFSTFYTFLFYHLYSSNFLCSQRQILF